MKALATAALLAITCLARVAYAQPMMMDPSKMSGIPRPDPQVPPGTITVRLIRGQLDKRMVGVDVTLTNAGGQASHQKTDAEGRATFASLAGGAYVASAKEGDTELKSQSIELQAQMGSRVMLVFPLGVGSADGVAHIDNELGAGTLVVRAEDAAGQAAEGLTVVVGQAKKGEQKVKELHGKTDVAGEAKFDGLDHDPSTGYLVEVVANGAKFTSKPFQLRGNAGTRVIIAVRAVSTDTSMLSLAEGSHILCEVTDDALQIIEVWRLNNAGTAAVDAGPDGLHLPLPDNALQAQAPDGNPNLSISGHEAVYRGPVAPGDTQLRVAFVLARKGSTAELVQRTPIPFTKVAMVTQRIDGVSVTGHGVKPEDREMQGRKLSVYFGEGTTRDGTLHLSFAGLPANDPTSRNAAAVIVILIVLVLGAYAVGGEGGRRAILEKERAVLLLEVVRLERDRATPDADRSQLDAERAKHVARLTEIYRALDELGVG